MGNNVLSYISKSSQEMLTSLTEHFVSLRAAINEVITFEKELNWSLTSFNGNNNDSIKALRRINQKQD